MLNGISPILIFHFYPEPDGATFKAIQGIPKVGDFLIKNVGIPIPIYLDQRLTGLYVESESKAIDVDTDFKQSQSPDVDNVFIQKGVTNLVSINMLAQKDSLLLTLILALNDQIFQKLVRQSYGITYLNGPTTVFNGLLHGFSSHVGIDDDLYRIVLQISKGNGQGTIPKNQIRVLSTSTAFPSVVTP